MRENNHSIIEFKSGIKIQINQAKVIEPPDLIERICLHCNQILEQYK